MNRTADAVVIGSGALGSATAFHLASKGFRVTLVDKFDLASQSTARAAGLSQQVQVDDVLARLAIRGVKALVGFRDYAGEDLEVVVNGSVKLARNRGDADQLLEEVRRGKELDVEIREVSASEAKKVAPWFNGDRAMALSYSPGDTYIENPGELPLAFIRALRSRGGEAVDHAEVTRVHITRGAVAGVTTTKGDIESPIVVDAGGAWAQVIGDMVGRVVPLWPVRHQLCITQPRADVDPHQATARVMDAKCYVRPARGGLMFGAYEPDPLVVDPRDRPSTFQIKDLPFEAEPLRKKMTGVAYELPVFLTAELAEVRGGLPTMTPDGHFLVDRMPGVEGFFVASGCNVGGLSISPPLGEDLAGWIVKGGSRPANLEPFRIDRFDGMFATKSELREACVATYAHKYDEQEVSGQ